MFYCTLSQYVHISLVVLLALKYPYCTETYGETNTNQDSTSLANPSNVSSCLAIRQRVEDHIPLGLPPPPKGRILCRGNDRVR